MVYQKKKVGEDQNSLIRYASILSNNNLDWISTVEGENGEWTMQRKHDGFQKCINKKSGEVYYHRGNCNGTMDYACGLNNQYHSAFINSPEFHDSKKVLEYCYQVFLSRPTAFNAYYKRDSVKDKFYLVTLNQ